MTRLTVTPADRRILAALQIDPRASWSKIAGVLGEPERSVARRGSELIESGAVRVVGMRVERSAAVLRLHCSPGMSRVATESLAQRHDTTFSYVMTGSADCVAEILAPVEDLPGVLTDQIPAITGVTRVSSYRVLRYFRTVRGWRGPALTAAEAARLATELTRDQPEQRWAVASSDPAAPSGGSGESGRVPSQDPEGTIMDVLVEDGRAPLGAIARRAGVSESTVARRVESLISDGYLQIRALVEPALFGLHVQAFLWLTLPPRAIPQVGQMLAAEPCVRWAAAVAGPYQIVADVTVASMAELYDFMTESTWASEAHRIESSLIVLPRKRSGHILSSSA